MAGPLPGPLRCLAGRAPRPHQLAGGLHALQVDDLGFEEAQSLTRPAMTYVRGQLRGRLTARLGRAYRRWLYPTSGRHPGERFP